MEEEWLGNSMQSFLKRERERRGEESSEFEQREGEGKNGKSC